MAENKERAETERRTDMKQIRRISEVAGELGETALIRLEKLSITEKVQKVDWVSVLCLDFSRLPHDNKAKHHRLFCEGGSESTQRGQICKNDTTTSSVILCFPTSSHWSSTLERHKTKPMSNIESFWESNRKKGVSTVVQTLHRVCF